MGNKRHINDGSSLRPPARAPTWAKISKKSITHITEHQNMCPVRSHTCVRKASLSTRRFIIKIYSILLSLSLPIPLPSLLSSSLFVPFSTVSNASLSLYCIDHFRTTYQIISEYCFEYVLLIAPRTCDPGKISYSSLFCPFYGFDLRLRRHLSAMPAFSSFPRFSLSLPWPSRNYTFG